MKLNGSVTYQNIVGLSRFICRKTAITTWFTQQKYLFFFLTKEQLSDKTVCCISWWGLLHISSTARGEPWTSSPVVLQGWQVVVRFTFTFFLFFFGEIHIFAVTKNQSSKQWRADIFAFGSAASVVSAGNVWDEKITRMCVRVYLCFFYSCG